MLTAYILIICSNSTIVFLICFHRNLHEPMILLISYQSSKEVRKKAAQTCLPHLMILINFSCLTVYDVLLLRLNTVVPKTVHFLITLQIIMYHPLFNPIVYGFKMKEISKRLKKLFGKKSGIAVKEYRGPQVLGFSSN
ncbi:olfactory receptor 52E2-like [Takifugu rubripes]|uniref:olfactory receptor 52E2-like n=1 Tax=Takifugu rubripes TaxID=31033 RepID=UPI0011460B67|nr:olfactory receptor 52E2-like [Takifugu rubripes]